MKFLAILLFTTIMWACSEKATKEESDLGDSSSLLSQSSSSSDEVLSSSLNQSNSFRLWIVEHPFSKTDVSFDNIVADSVWLEIQQLHSTSAEMTFLLNSFSCKTCSVQPALYGYVSLPDSTFQRGDTIHYRLAYTLDGKLDSTEWQEYGFLGNHTQLIFGEDTTTIQQFDSIQYPIVLGPQDSCGRAILSFIHTYNILDTFDYESNRNAIFSNGREYISAYDPFCHGDPQFKMAFFTLISYEGDINDAAKAIQKINPRFFLNLTPWCEELTACETVQSP